MNREIINVSGIADPNGPYNHAVRGAGLIFLTSQLACDLSTNRIMGGDIRHQTRQALENVRTVLEAAGSGMDSILRVHVYLRKLEDFDDMDEAYRESFAPGAEPARVTVQAPSPISGIDVEIEVTAAA